MDESKGANMSILMMNVIIAIEVIVLVWILYKHWKTIKFEIEYQWWKLTNENGYRREWRRYWAPCCRGRKKSFCRRCAMGGERLREFDDMPREAAWNLIYGEYKKCYDESKYERKGEDWYREKYNIDY